MEEKSLTAKKGRFICKHADGMAQRAAYKDAYSTQYLDDEMLEVKTGVMSKSKIVKARCAGLIRENDLRLKVSAAQTLVKLGEIAYMSLDDEKMLNGQVMMRDKLKALELLGRYLCMSSEKMEFSAELSIASALENARKKTRLADKATARKEKPAKRPPRKVQKKSVDMVAKNKDGEEENAQN